MEDAHLVNLIRDVHADSRRTYGAPRVHAELADDHGIRCGRKRVARLMRDEGLEGVHRRRKHRTTRRREGVAPAPDLVERDFSASGPDRLWVADIECHEALPNRAVVKGHGHRPVAACRLKLRAA